jgi:hypothetical protein
MIVTVAFDIKNYVEVMEGWPIEIGNMTFFLEREENIVRKVCISYSNVGIENAPNIIPRTESGGNPTITISSGGYATKAIKHIMNWQAVVSGVQIFDLDFDNYELRFHPQSMDEEKKIHLKSFRGNSKKALNSSCDFEQIGRAFCVDAINDSRIESSSHYREGRIAFEAGRYVDSYNNMFLFLETRYCDGKTKTNQQIELLSNEKIFRDSLTREIKEFRSQNKLQFKHLANIFDETVDIKTKIKTIVELRGKLRHHSLKSPHRWDPNRQNEYESPARFLGAVVGDIVIAESLKDIYAPGAVTKFREISVSTGFETKIEVQSHRLEKQPSLALDMSYPTTVISSQICLVAVRHAIAACAKDGQLNDTVRLDATQIKTDLELFTAELATWAYTPARSIETEEPIGSIRCSFEHYQAGVVVKNAFSFPIEENHINITYAWELLKYCYSWIEQKDPTTRILSLKLFLNKGKRPILEYKVGALVKN